MRVKNVTLGYTFDSRIIKTLLLSNARLYISAENPFTIARHKGMDPEVENTGISNNDIPNVRTFSVGINIGL
jgi:hypothetical protein